MVDREPAANAEPDSARDTRRQCGETLDNVYQPSRREETVKITKQFVSVIVNLFGVRPLKMWKTACKTFSQVARSASKMFGFFSFQRSFMDLFWTSVYSGQI